MDEGGAPVFRVLGPVEVRRSCAGPDGTGAGMWVDVAAAKWRNLLGVLLTYANQSVSIGALERQLWPDAAPRTSGKLVQHYVYQLRRVLGDRDGCRLRTRPSGYQLRAGPGDLDVDAFVDLAATGTEELKRGLSDRAAGTLARALAVWRGPAFADVPDVAAVRVEAMRLDECRLSVIETWVEAELENRRHREMVPELEALVTTHPLRERFAWQLMIALYRSERAADALTVSRNLRRSLRADLGLDLGPTVRRLEEAILRHDDSLVV